MSEMPADLHPKPENNFYKKHSDHAGFKAPPPDEAKPAAAAAVGQPEVMVQPPSS